MMVMVMGDGRGSVQRAAQLQRWRERHAMMMPSLLSSTGGRDVAWVRAGSSCALAAGCSGCRVRSQCVSVSVAVAAGEGDQ
jgi:hypothetical protein